MRGRSRSQWPRVLGHELSSLARPLGSWVRISLRVWMFRVCMRLFCAYVALCYVAALRWADHSSNEPDRLWKIIKELNKRPGPWIGGRSHWEKKWDAGRVTLLGEAHTSFWSENLKENDHLTAADIDSNIILKWNLRKWYTKLETVIICFRKEIICGILWTQRSIIAYHKMCRISRVVELLTIQLLC
jgi:hypothetical protein